MTDDLVRVNKYSECIKELPVYKRVSVVYPLLARTTVAQKLAYIAGRLPNGLFLQIDSAYRTRKTQEVLWGFRSKQMGDKAKEIVYDPSQGVPPHTTGGAVDISLVDNKGKEVNLSEPFKKFYDEPQLKSDKIIKLVQDLRLLINDLMLKEGFTPNPNEYWHFSYGDEAWARYNGKDVIYTEVELPLGKYFCCVLQVYYKITRKFWKLVNKVFAVQTNY